MAAEHRVDIGGTSLAVDDHPGPGTPILLLHAWLRNRHSWRDLAPALSRHSRVIVPDLPGFGASDIPDVAYDVPYYVGAVVQMLDAMGVSKVRIVGHGLGGAIAFGLGLDHPGRVERILAESPSWTENVLVGLRARYLMHGPLGQYAFRAALTRARVRQLLATRHFQEEDRVDDALVDAVWAPLSRRGAGRAAWRSLKTDLDPGLTERVAALSVPTMAVWGYNDRIHPIDLARQLETKAPAIKVSMIPNCGFAAHETRPRSFAVYLARQLEVPLDPRSLDDGHPKPREAY
jgi:4,5:9,10-diseco-3-hydroxy-5,9,17-trioxoandrosta-1(10),2-diene-4-oate hydrolase